MIIWCQEVVSNHVKLLAQSVKRDFSEFDRGDRQTDSETFDGRQICEQQALKPRGLFFFGGGVPKCPLHGSHIDTSAPLAHHI